MRLQAMRWLLYVGTSSSCAFVWPSVTRAEVTKVTIANRAVVAGGQAFGQVGPYEKLTGTIEFALDPADKHNSRIVDLEHATRGAMAACTSPLTCTSFDRSTRRRATARCCSRSPIAGARDSSGASIARANGSQDPTAAADFGDGFLMKEGYTLVWVGWQFDVQPPFVRSRLQPRTSKGASASPLSSTRSRRKRRPADLPAYPPRRRERSHRVADGARSLLGNADARAAREVAIQHSELVACASRSTTDSSRDASTRSTTPPPARKWPASEWLRSVMRRRRFAIAPTCRFAAARRISSAPRRADASCVSSCTTASTPTKRIAGRSISCGRISPARDGFVQRAFRSAGLQHVLSHPVPIHRSRTGRTRWLARWHPRRVSSRPDAESDLHEHVG